MMDSKRLLTIFTDQREELESNDMASFCPRREEGLVSLDSKLAQVVIGVRRSGKSTLCEKVLRQSGVAFAYANFDDDRLEGLETADFDRVLDALYQLYGDFRYLFLDEIQNVHGWQLFCNRLLRQKIHLLITGSNSKLLSTELTTHLTGRHAKIELYPFSFREYAIMKGVNMESQSTKAVAIRKGALRQYLHDGGFPELVDEENRRSYVEALLSSIIKNDIARRFRVKHVEVLRRMAAYLSDNFCQEFVASTVAELFGISDHTAENYYSHLKEAFLLLGVPRFSYKSKDRVRNEKVYVVDVAFVTDKEGTFMGDGLGWRLENTVFIELLRRNRPLYRDVFYYKEKSWEVDFVVAKDGRVEELIQVSFDISSEKTRRREVTALIRAAERFKCEHLTLVNFDEDAVIERDGHHVEVVSACRWL